MSRLAWTLRKARTLLAVAWSEALEYRAEMLIWSVYAFVPLILLAAWLAVGQGQAVGAYEPADFVAYFLFAVFLRSVTAVWIQWEFSYEVRTGQLNAHLLRPLHPVWPHLAIHLADRLFRSPITLAIVTIGFLLHPQAWERVATDRLPLFLLQAVLAFLLVFTLYLIVAYLAFWTTQATAVGDVLFAMKLLLGGFIAPLDLLPGPLRDLAAYLPFQYMGFTALNTVLGRGTLGEAWMAIAAAAIWTLVFLAAGLLVWRRGLRVYGAVGA